MAARVKERTFRATPPSGPLQTQPVRDLLGILGAFGRLGYDVGDLLAAARLTAADLEDPDAVLPCTVMGAIVQRALERKPLRNVALRLAAETPLGAFPLLDHLVASSETVAEGVGQLVRYLRLAGSPLVLEAFPDEDPVRVVAGSAIPFAVEYTLSLCALHFRRETGGRARIAALALAHRPDDAAEFTRVLGCPVQADAGWNGILFPAETWRLPLRRRDPTLRDLLESRAEEVLARTPRGSGTLFEVRRLLATRVAGGDTRLAVLAGQLATTARTLQRRLADQGATYHALVDEARRAAAESYLFDSTLSVGEIGYLLGYSEPGAFHRAFRRWHGTTPVAFRRRVQRKA